MEQIIHGEASQDPQDTPLHHTSSQHQGNSDSTSSVQSVLGKLSIGTVLQKQQEEQIGAKSIGIRDTGRLADAVRKAERDGQQETEVGLLEEAFSGRYGRDCARTA